MSVKPLVALAAILLVTLAGCGAKVPVGALAALPSPVAITGTVDNHYVPFNNGGNPAGQAPPPAGTTLQCVQDKSPTPPPSGAPQECTPASTRITANFTGLPVPEVPYSLWFAAGSDPALKIDDLKVAGETATVNKTFTTDLTGKYPALELRMGDFVYATASAAAGPQTFAPAQGLTGVDAKGTFDGKKLTLTVSGLPASNATYVGRLYTAAGVASKTAAESFSVTNGAVSYESKDHNIGEYVQFHIHVGTSMINLYKADLKANNG